MVKSLKGGKRNQFQERDAGIYECQIPTHPPQSYRINLNIIGWVIIVKIKTPMIHKFVKANIAGYSSACADPRFARLFLQLFAR